MTLPLVGKEKDTEKQQLTFYVEPEFKKEVADFVKGNRMIKSRNQLIELALKYYMRDFVRSRGALDQDGFPITGQPTEDVRQENLATQKVARRKV